LSQRHEISLGEESEEVIPYTCIRCGGSCEDGFETLEESWCNRNHILAIRDQSPGCVSRNDWLVDAEAVGVCLLCGDGATRGQESIGIIEWNEANWRCLPGAGLEFGENKSRNHCSWVVEGWC
jgi:hypothetical protein